MIPKIINYIWLGGNPLPPIAEKCIASWKKYCPDYEIIRWDESNLNIDCCNYCRQAYDAKKFAFASDVLRFDILSKHGGIYVDIDVEFLKPIDELLELQAFSGFETSGLVNPGVIIGCEPNHKIVTEVFNEYSEKTFEFNPGCQITVCNIFTDKLKQYGLVEENSTQELEGFKVFASDYFSPKSLSDGVIRKTKNTMSIHHFKGTWISKKTKFKTKLLMIIKRIVGKRIVNALKENKRQKALLAKKPDEVRVLHVLASNRYSGAENVACQIIKMSEQSIRSAYTSPNGVIADSLEDKKIKYYPMKKLTKRQLRRIIQEFKPTIIHAHDVRAIFISAFSTKRIPIIGHIHCNHKDFHKRSIRSILFKRITKRSNLKHVIFVSNGCYNDYIYRQTLKGKYSILHNIINVDEFRKVVECSTNVDESDIVFLGRLTQVKNPKRIIDITKLIKQEKPDVKVSVIGSGDMEEYCKVYANEQGVVDNIKFYGFLSNGYGILANSKIMLMTSLTEGTPMCALEAQIVGLPIVSTKTDGMVELLKNNDTGFLYDSNEEACEKILQLLQDQNLYQQLRSNVLSFSENYNNMDEYKNKIFEIYDFDSE